MPGNAMSPLRTRSREDDCRRDSASDVAAAIVLVLGASLSEVASRFSCADSRVRGAVCGTSADTSRAASVATLVSLFSDETIAMGIGVSTG